MRGQQGTLWQVGIGDVRKLDAMSGYDQNFWEERWSQVLRGTATVSRSAPERPSDRRARRPAPGARARRRMRPRIRHPLVAERIDWAQADLGTWNPQRDEYDLVVCLYVHIAGSAVEMVNRLASGVARGGTLFLVGHRPTDPATGGATAAAGQLQVSVDSARAALNANGWELIVAEDRPRPQVGTAVDAVIRARRRC